MFKLERKVKNFGSQNFCIPLVAFKHGLSDALDLAVGFDYAKKEGKRERKKV